MKIDQFSTIKIAYSPNRNISFGEEYSVKFGARVRHLNGFYFPRHIPFAITSIQVTPKSVQSLAD